MDSLSARPLISAIIPCYNVAQRFSLFQEAVLCALAQTYDNFEIVAVDDASSDGSAALIEDYFTGHKSLKARLVRLEQNGGTSVARNAGIAASLGEIVVFLDWDDLLFPEAFQQAVDAFRADSNLWVVIAPAFFYREYRGESRVFTLPIPRDINSMSFLEYCAYMVENNFPAAMGSGIFCRKELFVKFPHLKFDVFLSKTINEDILFGFRLLVQEIRPLFLDAPLTVHRGFIGTGSRSTDAWLKLDELAAYRYVLNEAVAALIAKVTAADASRGKKLVDINAKIEGRFRVKNLVRQNKYPALIAEVFSNPRLIKPCAEFMFRKYSSSFGGDIYLRVRGFKKLRTERAAEERVQQLFQGLRNSN